MHKFKSIAVSAAALLAALSFAACAGEEATPTVSATSTSVATAVPTSTGSPAATSTIAATSSPAATGTTVTPTATSASTPAAVITINLTAQNNSGQAGTATLTAKGNQTEVVMNLSTGPAGASTEQPVHIHTGTCASLGDVAHGLTNLVNGKSTTTVDVSLSTLLNGTFAINAHKSGAEASVYTACGEVKLPGSGTPTSSSPGSSSTPTGTPVLPTYEYN